MAADEAKALDLDSRELARGLDAPAAVQAILEEHRGVLVARRAALDPGPGGSRLDSPSRDTVTWGKFPLSLMYMWNGGK